MVTFRCAKCGNRKPTTGRKSYKRVGTGSDGRATYNYKCAECDKEGEADGHS